MGGSGLGAGRPPCLQRGGVGLSYAARASGGYLGGRAPSLQRRRGATLEVGYQTVARGCDLEAEAAGARVGAVGQLGGGSLQSPPLLRVGQVTGVGHLRLRPRSGGAKGGISHYTLCA